MPPLMSRVVPAIVSRSFALLFGLLWLSLLDRLGEPERCDADASVSGKFVNQVLLKERNAGLAEGLLYLLRRERKTFAAVGVLHLLGKGSVTALLREQGAQVERIY